MIFFSAISSDALVPVVQTEIAGIVVTMAQCFSFQNDSKYIKL